jgi:uncharacterized DUF497 family protein
MRLTGTIWLEEIIEKLAQKHQVDQDEVIEILSNSPRFRFVEKGFRAGEDVYTAMGQTDGGRYLVVFFVYKTDRRALIISAREMTKAERRSI